MGVPLDGVDEGEGGLGGMEGRAARGEQSTEKRVGQAGAERAEVTVINQSMDWNASFANCAWSILQAAAYQAFGSVSAGCPKGMVVI